MTLVDVDLEIEKSEAAAEDEPVLAAADLPSIHTDPFANREGKTLTWKNINMTLVSKSHTWLTYYRVYQADHENILYPFLHRCCCDLLNLTKAAKGDAPERKLLENVWGEVPKNCTTAVMGPSGAGKTSLLNILAGRASSRGAVTIQADVRLNNYSVDPTNIQVRKQIAFVAQDDSLQVTSTPRESIRFSAKLRLPRTTTDEDLDKLTQRMITELGLTSCADTIVGGALIKGISGGERKRTSVGVELVVVRIYIYILFECHVVHSHDTVL